MFRIIVWRGAGSAGLSEVENVQNAGPSGLAIPRPLCHELGRHGRDKVRRMHGLVAAAAGLGAPEEVLDRHDGLQRRVGAEPQHADEDGQRAEQRFPGKPRVREVKRDNDKCVHRAELELQPAVLAPPDEQPAEPVGVCGIRPVKDGEHAVKDGLRAAVAEGVLPGGGDTRVTLAEESADDGRDRVPSAADVLFFAREAVRGFEVRADTLGADGCVRAEYGDHQRVEHRVAEFVVGEVEEVMGPEGGKQRRDNVTANLAAVQEGSS